MRKSFIALSFVLATGLGAFGNSPEAHAGAYDCAHGPDTYRVRNVEDWDSLNLRAGPSSRYQRVGAIHSTGSGIHCLGPCQGNWCRVSWRGVVGWTNMKFLGE